MTAFIPRIGIRSLPVRNTAYKTEQSKIEKIKQYKCDKILRDIKLNNSASIVQYSSITKITAASCRKLQNY